MIPTDSQRARELLLAVADDPEGPAARAFDAFFYSRVFRFVRKQQIAHPDGQSGTGSAEPVSRADETAAAHDATLLALGRARRSAHRFDPTRGRAEHWVLRAAVFAYVETAREYTGARSSVSLISMGSEEYEAEATERRSSPDHAELTAEWLDLQAGLERLDELECQALVLTQLLGFAYVEVAQMLFSDRKQSKRVDHLVQSARAKLRSDEVA